jgi:hypothetical protein
VVCSLGAPISSSVAGFEEAGVPDQSVEEVEEEESKWKGRNASRLRHQRQLHFITRSQRASLSYSVYLPVFFGLVMCSLVRIGGTNAYIIHLISVPSRRALYTVKQLFFSGPLKCIYDSGQMDFRTKGTRLRGISRGAIKISIQTGMGVTYRAEDGREEPRSEIAFDVGQNGGISSLLAVA